MYCWNGSSWVSFKAAGSVNTVVGDTAGIVNLSIATSGDQVTITTSLDNTTGAAEFLAGPTATGGAVSYRQLASGDLPTAGVGGKGAVQVSGNGLTMSGDLIAIDNTVVASSTNHLVTYDANGLVTGGATIGPGDLPIATDLALGGVRSGTGLAIDVVGVMNHVNVVAAGTATKVTFDAQGHITVGEALAATDLPNHSAALLTTGTLDVGRLAANSVTGVKLANYAISKFGETQPVADHIGQFFFNPLTRDLFLWDGNVYQPVGISVGEIVFAGTYDAGTNLIASVTQDGTAAGFVTGAALAAASAINNKYYFVVSEPGTGVAPAPAVALNPPDILLSNGTNWTLVDVSDTVVAQIASNIQVTPAGGIGSTNVQSALEELDTEKLPKAGGVMTGNLELSDGVVLIFEGSTGNAFETTLTVVDPTADNTITLPDATGTVALTSDLNDGTY